MRVSGHRAQVPAVSMSALLAIRVGVKVGGLGRSTMWMELIPS